MTATELANSTSGCDLDVRGTRYQLFAQTNAPAVLAYATLSRQDTYTGAIVASDHMHTMQECTLSPSRVFTRGAVLKTRHVRVGTALLMKARRQHSGLRMIVLAYVEC